LRGGKFPEGARVCLFVREWDLIESSAIFARLKQTFGHGKMFLKLTNNSSSLNKGNHDRDGVWISDLRFLRLYFSDFSLVLVQIEKIYQTLKTAFNHISKHLEVIQKYYAARRIFNSPRDVWKCGQTRLFLFDMLLERYQKLIRNIL